MKSSVGFMVAKFKFRITLNSLFFILLIGFPILNTTFKLVHDIPSSENRGMAARPEFNLDNINQYPADFEKYYSDNFTVRALMVKYFNIMNLKFFKKSPVPDKVVLGKNGWLFVAGTEDQSFTGQKRLTAEELKAFKQELEYRADYLKKRNCEFYFLIAPAKGSVYSELVPNYEYRRYPESWGEQLLGYLNKNSKIKTIDAFKTLREHKKKQQLFLKLDNHWTQIGAFYAAQEVLKRIHRDFQEVAPSFFGEYKLTSKFTCAGNIVKMLSNASGYKDSTYSLTPKSGFLATEAEKKNYPVPSSFPYPNEFEIETENDSGQRPNILIISDSFGLSIFPFLAEHFSRSVKIFDGWEYKLNENIVNAEKPDIMLLIILEANLRNMLSYQSRLKADKL